MAYNHAFLIKELSLKLKTVFNPWMTKGLQKSSKRKQKLYNKFLKSKTNENEKKYKAYNSLFEIRKKIYYSRNLDSCKQNMKKTWDTVKEVIGKSKTFKNDIPERTVIEGAETFGQEKLLMDSTNILLKSGLSLHPQSQPLPKISNSS